jgi:hypothetical protein
LGQACWDQEFRADGCPEAWTLGVHPPSRRAKCPKGLDLTAARRGTTIALAAIETPRFFGIVSTFVDVPGLEPTNNFGERCIRYGVVYRKTSFGTQSAQGSRFVERLLTTVTTLK